MAFRQFFQTSIKCRPEVADDVMFCAAEEQVGMAFPVKCADSMLNLGRNIRLVAGRTRLTHFMQYFAADRKQLVTAYLARFCEAD